MRPRGAGSHADRHPLIDNAHHCLISEATLNLFSTWIAQGKDFDVSNVRDTLSAFSRLINPGHKPRFDGIFKTLETGLSKLGESARLFRFGQKRLNGA